VGLNLVSVQAKLQRAEEHSLAVRNDIKPWMATNPYKITREVNADATRYSLIAHLVGREPELQKWSLIVGDCLHNLRSALDHLVYTVAAHQSGKEPPPDEKNLMFVIADTSKNFSDSSWRIQSLSQPVRKVIETVQPFNRRHSKLPPLLAVLRDLENTDKHKLLRLAYASIAVANIGLSGPQKSIANVPQFIPHGGEIKDGSEIFAAVFKSPEPDLKFDQTDLDLVIALWHGKRDPAEPPWHEHNDCYSVLNLLATEVRTVVEMVVSAVE
jgi:hypothetical protein